MQMVPLFHSGTIISKDFSIAGMGCSLLGVILLQVIVNLSFDAADQSEF